MDEKVKTLKIYMSLYRNETIHENVTMYRDLIENMFLDELDRADKTERELAALKEQTRWIPVSERLPDDKQEIYARDYTGTVSRWKYSIALVSIFMRHYTHWLPIPEPPENEDD